MNFLNKVMQSDTHTDLLQLKILFESQIFLLIFSLIKLESFISLYIIEWTYVKIITIYTNFVYDTKNW